MQNDDINMDGQSVELGTDPWVPVGYSLIDGPNDIPVLVPAYMVPATKMALEIEKAKMTLEVEDANIIVSVFTSYGNCGLKYNGFD